MTSKHAASERVHWVAGVNDRTTRCGSRAWRLKRSAAIEQVTCHSCLLLHKRDHAPPGPTPEQIEAERGKAKKQAQRQYASPYYAKNRAALLQQARVRYVRNQEEIKARQRARYAERKAKRMDKNGK